MFKFFKELFCVHEWRIWWSRSNSYSRIEKRSCKKCKKVERVVDTFGA